MSRGPRVLRSAPKVQDVQESPNKENFDPRKGSKRLKEQPGGDESQSSSSSSNSELSSSDESSDNEPILKRPKLEKTSNTVDSRANDSAKAQDLLRMELRKAQEELDCLREEQKNSDRRFADFSNERSADSRKRKQSPSIKDKKTHINAKDRFAKEIDSLGKHFAIQYHLFINVKDLKHLTISKNYAPQKRFAKKEPEMEHQGVIYDILELLPRSLAKKCRKRKEIYEWILDRMKSTMSAERSTAVRRIRKDVGSKLFDCGSDIIENDAERGEHPKLGARGLQLGADDYFNVEILHSDYCGEFDIDKIFLNPLLMQAYSSLVFGIDSVKQVKSGHPPAPVVETSSSIWSLSEITPGAIATASVLVLYAVSPDRAFYRQGGITGFDWKAIHDEYFRYLWKGKIEKRRSVLNIFRTWNSVLYPKLASNAQIANKKKKKNPVHAAEAALEEDIREVSESEDEEQQSHDKVLEEAATQPSD